MLCLFIFHQTAVKFAPVSLFDNYRAVCIFSKYSKMKRVRAAKLTTFAMLLTERYSYFSQKKKSLCPMALYNPVNHVLDIGQ